MKWSVLLLIFLMSKTAYCQSDNADNIRLIIRQPLLFAYEGFEQMLSPKTISNAFELKLKAKNRTCNVSVTLQSTSSSDLYFLTNRLLLRPTYVSSPTLSAMSEVPLSPMSSILLSVGGSTNTEHHTILYDLVMMPTAQFPSSNNIGFTILFTMAQP